MSFDWNGRMQTVINLAKDRGAALDQLKGSGMYTPDYISQNLNQYRQEVQTARDKVISDFTADANNQLQQIQDEYIKSGADENPIAALLKLNRIQSIIKAMTTDELKNQGYEYKANGFLNDPERNNMDYLNTLMGELGTRNEFGLVSQMKQAMSNIWHTNEPWKQDEAYQELQGQLESTEVMNQYEPDALWLKDSAASNNHQNTHYFIHNLIA